MAQNTYDGQSNTGASIVWWGANTPKRDRLVALVTDVTEITNDSRRQTSYDTYSSLYLNRRIDVRNAVLGGYAEAFIDAGRYTRTPYNLLKRVVDECVVRVVKTTPKARFLPHGGDRESKRRAKGMQSFVDSEMYKLRSLDRMRFLVNDAALYGLGAIKFYKHPREDAICSERVHPGNLFVDPNEVIFNHPTRLHQRAIVSKNLLTSLFPQHKEAIRKSHRVASHRINSTWFPDYSAGLEQVELWESWHLPDYETADGKYKNGWRVLWVGEAILQIEAYNRREFPFAFMRWREDPSNMFYGVGLGEDLMGVHLDCNITINRVNAAIETIPNPYVVVREQTDVNVSHITDEPGVIIKYSGGDPPQIIMPNSVPQDLLQYVREHESRAMQIAGLSVGGGAHAVPSGLETGRAVANYFQVESLPFANQLKKYEQVAIDIANNIVAVGKGIYEKNPSFSVLLETEKNTVRNVPWKDISADPQQDSYVIRALPTSQLSELPAQRLAEVERLQQMMVVQDPKEAREMLGWPDLEAKEDRVNATRDNIDRMIYLALDEGTFTPIAPTTDTDLFVIRATAEAERAADMGVPAKNIAILNRMIARANEMSQQRSQVQMLNASGAIAPSGVPNGPNGAPPTAIQGPT